MIHDAAIRLGFVPLNDAAALLVAREMGWFESAGLVVDLVREASWATVRDKLAAGVLDGAHILAPLALAMTAGVACEAAPMITPFALNFGGAAISVPVHLSALAEAGGLSDLVRRRQAQGASRLTFASVFPFSIHEYCLRQWIADAGLDPDVDVRLTVVPPSRAADLLAENVIEGFCAGEPWNASAVSRGLARVVARVEEVLPPVSDKVCALDAGWAAEHEDAVLELVRVLDRASAWVAAPANRRELLATLARPDAIAIDAEIIEAGLKGMIFHGGGANRPNLAHADWILSRMRRWNQNPAAVDTVSLAARVYRSDIHDRALGISA